MNIRFVNLRLSLIVLFLACGGVVFAQQPVQPDLKNISAGIADDAIRGDTLASHLYDNFASHAIERNRSNYDSLLVMYKARYTRDPSPYNQYALSKFQTDWLIAFNEMANALHAARKAEDACRQSKDSSLIVRSQILLGYTYEVAGLYKQAIDIYRKAFLLQILIARTKGELTIAYGGYSWRCNTIGRATNDSLLLDSAIFFRQKSLQIQKEQLANGDKITVADFYETYITLQLGCLRVKKYQGAISFGMEALSLIDSIWTVYPEQDREDIYRLNLYIARGYVGLRNEDSAMHYLAMMEKSVISRRNYADGRGSFLHSFGHYKEAASWYTDILFPEGQLRYDPDLVQSYNQAATSFYLAGEYEKAAFCYKYYGRYNDSISRLNTSAQEEFIRVNTELQVQDVERAAQLEKEQLELIAEQDRKTKRNILFWSILVVVMLIVGITIIYKRLQENKKQKRVIEQQNDKITSALALVEQKNTEISDSINYARRIQDAILPDEQLIKETFSNSFIFYRPKDVVAGDFYWMRKTISGTFIAAGDCTGHGVPGAFMSLIAVKELNLAADAITTPGHVLSVVNREMKNVLNQHTDSSTHDGMDIALIKISNTSVQFSGAHRPFWYISSGRTEINETKGTKASIAGRTSLEQEYANHEFQLQTGDTLYIFSDGFADQFGGDKQKKLSTKGFRNLLLSIQHLSMKDQHTEIQNFFDKWKFDIEQIDDVLVIGIRL